MSAVLNMLGVSVTYDAMDRTTGELMPTTVTIQSLLTADGVRFMFTNAIRAFTGHAALGTILVAMLGVGVAESSGLISAMLKRVVLATPKRLITPILVFAGIMSNVASNVGYVVLVPLGAIVFMSFGRHPLAGIAAAFAGVSGGFSANLVVGSTDPLLGGISTEAARILDPTYMVTPVANYYFMFVSTFLITIVRGQRSGQSYVVHGQCAGHYFCFRTVCLLLCLLKPWHCCCRVWC
ncbi:AbgT family transporter [Endozoicomonas lisbonensis]|uniref:AbgT family transporter n=1 Tax=Endozoicomonas lisbonensis TaxID=3120522 RepID=UPI0033908B98